MHLNAQSQGDDVYFDIQCADRLRQERERLGFSQQDFAAQIGVRREMWSKYERGQAIPGGEALAAFAAVGGDILFVLKGGSAIAAVTEDERELLAGYRALDVRGKAGMLGLLHGMGSTSAVFHGSVGQAVQGNLNGPVTIDMGGGTKKKKKQEEPGEE